jgi:hypothetical protein
MHRLFDRELIDAKYKPLRGRSLGFLKLNLNYHERILASDTPHKEISKGARLMRIKDIKTEILRLTLLSAASLDASLDDSLDDDQR